MADYLKTISNTILCFGLAKTTKWGSVQPMTWGSSQWGDTSDVETQLDMAMDLANTVTVTDDYVVVADFVQNLSDSMTVDGDMYSETLQTQNGYYYNFVAPTSEAEDRNFTTYTAQSRASTSFTTATPASTTWGAA